MPAPHRQAAATTSNMFAATPAWARFIIWLLIVAVAIILAALIVHALGGFSMRIGHFRLGVT
jgi:hypothetical protein